MKQVYLAHWSDDTSPEFADETLEGLFSKIDEWYGKEGERIFKRSTEKYESCFFGTVTYEYMYKGEKETDSIKILNYYY